MLALARTAAVAVALTALATPGALAASAGTPKAGSRSQAFDYKADEISTDRLRPPEALKGVVRAPRTKLIALRLDFVAELLRSTEDL